MVLSLSVFLYLYDWWYLPCPIGWSDCGEKKLDKLFWTQIKKCNFLCFFYQNFWKYIWSTAICQIFKIAKSAKSLHPTFQDLIMAQVSSSARIEQAQADVNPQFAWGNRAGRPCRPTRLSWRFLQITIGIIFSLLFQMFLKVCDTFVCLLIFRLNTYVKILLLHMCKCSITVNPISHQLFDG